MSYSELQSGHRKGRKDHICEWCSTKITKGELHFYRAYVWCGDFNHGRMHLECELAMTKSNREYLEEGWCPGDFKRGEIAS